MIKLELVFEEIERIMQNDSRLERLLRSSYQHDLRAYQAQRYNEFRLDDMIRQVYDTIWDTYKLIDYLAIFHTIKRLVGHEVVNRYDDTNALTINISPQIQDLLDNDIASINSAACDINDLVVVQFFINRTNSLKDLLIFDNLAQRFKSASKMP